MAILAPQTHWRIRIKHFSSVTWRNSVVIPFGPHENKAGQRASSKALRSSCIVGRPCRSSYVTVVWMGNDDSQCGSDRSCEVPVTSDSLMRLQTEPKWRRAVSNISKLIWCITQVPRMETAMLSVTRNKGAHPRYKIASSALLA